MRRRATTTIVGAALAAALAVAAAPAQGAADSADAKLVACSQPEQSAVFRGRMSRAPEATQMAMRFSLLSTLGSTGGERKVRVPGLGRWHKSKPDVAGFSFKQEFLNLTGGGSYRVRIDFRWYDAAGTVVKSTKRRSPACKQLDRLPNLRVQVVSGQPTQTKGVWRYGLRVGNDGLALAAGIGVRLSIDGAVAGQTTVAALDPGGWTRLSMRGPACERWVDAEIDFASAINESNELDNRQQLACADLPSS
jgi:CARDB